MKEIVKWIESSDSLSRKGNNIFEAKFSKGSITRKDVPKLKNIYYMLVLDEESCEKIITELRAGYSFTIYQGSAIHFLSGNYITVEGEGAMPKIKEILNIEIIW